MGFEWLLNCIEVTFKKLHKTYTIAFVDVGDANCFSFFTVELVMSIVRLWNKMDLVLIVCLPTYKKGR